MKYGDSQVKGDASLVQELVLQSWSCGDFDFAASCGETALQVTALQAIQHPSGPLLTSNCLQRHRRRLRTLLLLANNPSGLLFHYQTMRKNWHIPAAESTSKCAATAETDAQNSQLVHHRYHWWRRSGESFRSETGHDAETRYSWQHLPCCRLLPCLDSNCSCPGSRS